MRRLIAALPLLALCGCALFNPTMLRIAVLIDGSRAAANAFNYDHAIALMDEAIALDADNPLLHVERGQRIMLLYEWDRALADYNRALEIDPGYADAYYYRAVLHYSVGEWELAQADFAAYLENAPQGKFAADSARYIDNIAVQLEALSD